MSISFSLPGRAVTHQDYGYSLHTGESVDLKSTSATKLDDAHADMVTKLKTRGKHSFTTSWGPVGFKKSRHPLSIMVREMPSITMICYCA